MNPLYKLLLFNQARKSGQNTYNYLWALAEAKKGKIVAIETPGNTYMVMSSETYQAKLLEAAKDAQNRPPTELDPEAKERIKKIVEVKKVTRLLYHLAQTTGWELLDYQPKTSMISFRRDGVRLNIYLLKSGLYTVGTAMLHPTKGKTQLFRRQITEREVHKLMQNPRLHTGEGYYRK